MLAMAGTIVDVELVRALVRDQFSQWADLPVSEVERRGWDNLTFRLGDDMAVRCPAQRDMWLLSRRGPDGSRSLPIACLVRCLRSLRLAAWARVSVSLVSAALAQRRDRRRFRWS
jgi:aminoglycoside phosphotransferase (APT) family kinase protein